MAVALISVSLPRQRALLLERTRARRDYQRQQVLLIVRQNGSLQEYLDDADQVAEALRLRPLVQVALALLWASTRSRYDGWLCVGTFLFAL